MNFFLYNSSLEIYKLKTLKDVLCIKKNNTPLSYKQKSQLACSQNITKKIEPGRSLSLVYTINTGTSLDSTSVDIQQSHHNELCK